MPLEIAIDDYKMLQQCGFYADELQRCILPELQ